mmetsp:Transcript_77603/g.240442  ORF Transcript_77603/g.240442 Transcript_77603/m.240442 type:complete len:203 (-) Transcript_77603:394-1002(-)
MLRLLCDRARHHGIDQKSRRSRRCQGDAGEAVEHRMERQDRGPQLSPQKNITLQSAGNQLHQHVYHQVDSGKPARKQGGGLLKGFVVDNVEHHCGVSDGGQHLPEAGTDGPGELGAGCGAHAAERGPPGVDARPRREAGQPGAVVRRRVVVHGRVPRPPRRCVPPSVLRAGRGGAGPRQRPACPASRHAFARRREKGALRCP